MINIRFVLAGTGLLLLSFFQVRATHIIGADLSYSYVTGSTYEVILVLYGDCAATDTALIGQLRRAQPGIDVYDGVTRTKTIYITWEPSSGNEIARNCPLEATSCNGGSAPGIKKYIYSGVCSLSAASQNWRFVFNSDLGSGYSAGRSSSLTNILSTGSTRIVLEAKLNNTISHNSSPVLATDQPQYFCLYRENYYTPAATDPDGDSLHFELVPGKDAGGDTVTYMGGASGGYPITCGLHGLGFDPGTGALSFYPIRTERDLVVYKISEYRGNTLVGTSQREMTALLRDCAGTCDSVAAVGDVRNKVNEKIEVYPNPSYGSFVVSLPAYHAGQAYVTVEDVTGRVLQSQTIKGGIANKAEVVLPANTPKGTYFVKVLTGGNMYREKVVVW